jgi:hypothetical protein
LHELDLCTNKLEKEGLTELATQLEKRGLDTLFIFDNPGCDSPDAVEKLKAVCNALHTN